MKRILAAILLAVPAVPNAAALSEPVAVAGHVIREEGEITVNGEIGTVTRYTWPDSLGRARSVALLAQPGGSPYAVRMTFQVDDGGLRTVNVDAAPGFDGGFGYFVSHEAYRTWSDDAPPSTIAFRHGYDDAPLGRYLSAGGVGNSSAFADQRLLGPRTVHQSFMNYPRWGTSSSMPNPQAPTSASGHVLYQIPVVIRWAFTAGHDYPYWSVEVDLSQVGDRVAMDVRGPYGVMNFNEGTGNAVTALRWGDMFRFAADAGSGDFGTVAVPAASLPWAWDQPNTGRRYNVLGSGNYEFGLVTPFLASQWYYGDGFAEARGLTSAAPYGCDYGMLSMPCDFEWAFHSFQYDYGPPTRPKIAWGSSPYLGSSLTSVPTSDTTTVPLIGKGRITYGVHVVYGRGGAGTPLTLAQAAAPIGGPYDLELRAAPKTGGSVSARAFGESFVRTDRNRPLPAWSSVEASATAANGYQFLGFDHDCGTAGGCAGTPRPCAGSHQCRFAMDGPMRTVAVFALPGTTVYPRPLFLDFAPQAAGTVSAPQGLKMVSFSAPAAKSVIVQSNSPEFVVTQDAAQRPCSSGHEGAALVCGVQVQFAPAPGPARTVRSTLVITSNQSAPVWVDVEGVVAGMRAPLDMDNDGRSDIMWRNSSTGHVWRMLMNGFSVSSNTFPWHEPDARWKIVADGDLNGDGHADLVWRNTSTGQVVLQHYGAGHFPNSTVHFTTEPSQDWQVVHTPDLDGDGHADLLWWNSVTGQVYAHLIGHGLAHAQGFVYQEGDTNWRIAAVGDFGGTGKRNQLLWRNQVTGQVYLMTVSYAAGFSVTGSMLYAEPDTTWKIVGTGDFDGNGRSDILWRQDGTGLVYMMLKGDGNTFISQGFMHVEPNPAWRIVAFGDYDGDGRSDILWWQSTTGHVHMMRMNGLAIAAQQGVYREANTAWKPLGPGTYPQ